MTKKVLERWPPGPREGGGVLEGRKITPRKNRSPRQQGGFRDIRQWFEQGKKPPKEAPERREECGSKEPQQNKSQDR